MKVIKVEKVKKEKNSAPLFTGDVNIQYPVRGKKEDLTIGYVHFPKNVRNKFHKHSNDQVLIVTKGKGFFRTKTKKYILEEGDIAWSPAGEVHSHGALEDSDFTHITVTRAKTKLTQIEK
jgi:quercetin dioxygenase-like cupin family protein